MLIGYARVSTKDQNLDRQIDAFKKLGIDDRNVFKEKHTGTIRKRPEFERMMAYLETGDILVVESISRIGRSVRDLLNIMNELNEKKVQLKILSENIDTTTITGQFMYGVFALIYDYDHKMKLENICEGFAAGKARGKKYGAPFKLKPYEMEQLKIQLQSNRSPRDLAQELNMTVQSIYNYRRRFAENPEPLSIS